MHFVKNFDASSYSVLISGKSPNAGTSGTAIKNLNVLDNLINYDALAELTVSLSSSNQAADIATGTGARTVRIFGLSAVTYLPITEDINLHATDGRTTVSGTKVFSRVFAAEVVSAGTGNINAGDIYIYTFGTSMNAGPTGIPVALTTTWLKILVGEGGASNGFYTVPAGKTAKISSIMMHTRTQIGVVSIWTKSLTSNSRENIFQIGLPATTPVVQTDILKNAYTFPEKTAMYIRFTPVTTLALGTVHMTVSLKDM